MVSVEYPADLCGCDPLREMCVGRRGGLEHCVPRVNVLESSTGPVLTTTSSGDPAPATAFISIGSINLTVEVTIGAGVALMALGALATVLTKWAKKRWTRTRSTGRNGDVPENVIVELEEAICKPLIEF